MSTLKTLCEQYIELGEEWKHVNNSIGDTVREVKKNLGITYSIRSSEVLRALKNRSEKNPEHQKTYDQLNELAHRRKEIEDERQKIRSCIIEEINEFIKKEGTYGVFKKIVDSNNLPHTSDQLKTLYNYAPDNISTQDRKKILQNRNNAMKKLSLEGMSNKEISEIVGLSYDRTRAIITKTQLSPEWQKKTKKAAYKQLSTLHS